MIARIALTYPVFSATMDEGLHIAAGVEVYQESTYTALVEQPPLSRFATGLLPYLGGVRTLPDQHLFVQGRYVLENSGDYWEALTLGRAGNLVFIPILVFYTFCWSSRLYGRGAALVAVALVTFCPTILAHAGLATVDLAITVTLVGAAYHLYRWLEAPRFLQALAAGCLVGLALMSKYSALGFVPVIAGSFALTAIAARRLGGTPWSGSALRLRAAQLALLLGACVLVVWSCFAWNTSPVGRAHTGQYESVERVFPAGGLLNRVASGLIGGVRSAAPGLLEGISDAVNHARSGHAAQYLLGEVRYERGWWYYFPIALAVKLTLPFLLLIALSLIACYRRPGTDRATSLYPALGALSVLGVGMFGEVNIGVRHVMPMLPFLAISASALFENHGEGYQSGRRLVAIGVLLVLGHGLASAAAHPDYLAYFNELARGNERYVLGDSNLDWGQDLGRLSSFVQEHELDEIDVSCLGPTSLVFLGVENARTFLPQDRPNGWVAISAFKLQGLDARRDGGAYDWLLRHEPQGRVGKSIWIYYLNE